MRIKKYAISIIAILSLLMISIPTYAQFGTGEPICDPEDTTPACQGPLDTYVYILAAVAIIFTYYHLQKQKKSLAVK